MPLGISPINRHGLEPMAASEHFRQITLRESSVYIQMSQSYEKVTAPSIKFEQRCSASDSHTWLRSIGPGALHHGGAVAWFSCASQSEIAVCV